MKSAEFKPSFKTAPVLVLDRDVLLFIFNLNADIFSDENSLKSTRLASQVCRGWRDVILQTPSIWGRLIDLDQLVSSTDDWKAEVLRRSGDASLWIRRTGIIFESRPTYTKRIQEFFFSVLDKHWDRIEQLVVSMDVGGLNGELWSAIYRPSPRLRVFSLDLHAFAMDPTSTPSSKTLFSGYAPVLHTFDGAVIQFELQAPWFSNLRSIQLGSRLTFSEILHAFNLMPRIESIQIDQAKPINLNAMEMSHLPRPQLQNLRYLRLSSNLTTCAAFVEYITPAHGCTVNIHAAVMPDESLTDPGRSATFVRRLSKLAEDYFTNSLSPAISLYVNRQSFSLRDKTPIPASVPRFSVSITKTFGEPLPKYIISLLFSVFNFSVAAFDSVTELKLGSLTSPPLDSSFDTFFLSLSSIKILSVQETVLEEVLQVQEQSTRLLFPQLEIIRLEALTVGFFTPESNSRPLFRFLYAQRDSGNPISILDLTECALGLLSSFEFFEGMVGHKVVWNKWGADGLSEQCWICQ